MKLSPRIPILLAAIAALPALAQSPAADTAPKDEARVAETKPAEGPLAPLAWLSGCWRGSANQREFREHWMPLRGNLLIGTGHTTVGERTQDFEYLRIEARADGVHYVALPSGQKETSFRLGEPTTDGGDALYTFENPAQEFPQRIVYRRGTQGWMYINVEGKVGGQDRRVIYPLRRTDCESGELIFK